VVELFRYLDTNAWPHIKNFISLSMLDSKIRLESGNSGYVFKSAGIRIVIKSIISYLKILFDRQKRPVYMGATTGLLKHNGEIYDAYFPYAEYTTTTVSYMLNCGNLPSLSGYDVYLKKNNIVIENYLCAPIKLILSMLVYVFISRSKRFEKYSQHLARHCPSISNDTLLKAYANFVAGYHVYKAFFRFLAISDAYVVSAYTKSDIVAALKHFKIPVTEIQHGIIGRFHPGYNYSVKSSCLPIPDRIDVYNEFWKQDLRAGGYFTEGQIRIVGRVKYKILDNFTKPYDRYIVFTGQASYFDEIAKFLRDSNETLTKHECYLIYKPHPKETPAELVRLKLQTRGCSNVLIYEGTATAEQIISQAFAHVSIFSACHFDAIHFLNQSFIFDILENNFMNCYADHFEKTLVKIKSIEEIFRRVQCR
jgi:hypothetical protein